MSDVDPPADERRGSRRCTVVDTHGVTSVRVRPGIQATLVNLSSTGAALDTDRRLLPGRFVHVQLVSRRAVSVVRGRVVRTHVIWMTAGRIVYRCALQFDRPLPAVGAGDDAKRDE